MRRKYGFGTQQDPNIKGEDVNPMDGLANLADIMLVFACGLMLALIINWNVDVAGTAKDAVPVGLGQEVTDMSGLSGDKSEAQQEDAQYEEYGVVYRDPATGKLYMVTEGETDG